MDWARILAYVTGTVDQELLARIEYLAAENRILKAQLKGRLKLSDAERATLAEIGHRLGRKALAEVATVARPDTILAWYRKLVAHIFDGSKARRSLGRPRIKREVEQLIVRMAKENHDWGYDRIVGAVASENPIQLTRGRRRIRTSSPHDCNRPPIRPHAVRLLQAATAAGSRDPGAAASTQHSSAAGATSTAFALGRSCPVHLALPSLPWHP